MMITRAQCLVRHIRVKPVNDDLDLCQAVVMLDGESSDCQVSHNMVIDRFHAAADELSSRRVLSKAVEGLAEAMGLQFGFIDCELSMNYAKAAAWQYFQKGDAEVHCNPIGECVGDSLGA